MKSSICLLSAAAALQGALAQDRPSLDEYKDKKSEEKASADAAAADQSKMAAVDKVITMLDDLQKQVLAEGEAEAQTYNKFSCFCKDTTREKTDAIKKGEDSVAALSATIESLASDRDGLDTTISGLEADIAAAEKTIAEAKAERKATLDVYEKNEADMSGAIAALEGAIEALKASKGPSLVQLQSMSKTLRLAADMADALGYGENAQKAMAFLQQAPDVPMENYKFHSGDIIDTLENLLKDFRAKKVDIDKEEVSSVAAHDSLVQEQTDILKAKNGELDAAKKSKAQKQEEIATNSAERSTTAAVLLDDQKYLMEMSQMCADKAKTWDQRTKVRADELSAITAATEIIKSTVAEKTQSSTIRFAQEGVSVRLAHVMAQSPEAMQAVEAEAEAADAEAPAFLQVSKSKGFLAPAKGPKDGRDAAIMELREQGAKLRSTLLTSLASKLAEDPFAKVKVLIQELIERLLKEANAEANQKGWCDKATKDANQKRDYAAEQVLQLNGEMATAEALRDKLTEELSVLSEEIEELNAKREEAEKLRAEEKAENEHTVSEAEAGLEAVVQAIDILKKFYATVAKEKVEFIEQPEKDAPDAGFKNMEAYKGAQSEAGGIVGMLEVIQSDFERTISETEKAEAQAEQDHLAFMTETGVSLAEKTTAHDQKTAENEAAKEKLADADENMKSQNEILLGAVKELLDLKPVCVDTGMSYEERVARREDEIAALKKADCILGAYAEYGPEGLADAC